MGDVLGGWGLCWEVGGQCTVSALLIQFLGLFGV